jgi:hypothetical protein
LIDECLSARLVGLAVNAGYEAAHVARIGKQGTKDWELAGFIAANDWTFVTRNSIDFRGPRNAPGSKGLHARMQLHAGLVCLNGPPKFDMGLHYELFGIALETIVGRGDLVNMGLEITLEEIADAEVVVSLYPIPQDGPYSIAEMPYSKTVRRLSESVATFVTAKSR